MVSAKPESGKDAAGARDQHIPVMRDRAIDALAVRADGTYLDGTFGRGGHAREILLRLGERGRLLLMDKDPDAIRVATEEFAADARVSIRHSSFAEMAEWTEARNSDDGARVDGVLLDLGVSSPQIDQAERGFSFMNDGPLDMRMNPHAGESAAEWLARAGEREIADVLWQYGEEKASRRIAKAIVETRVAVPIVSTLGLAGLIAKLVGRGTSGKHPATRTFQAIRIHVNRELVDLDAGLEASAKVLKPGGRLAVISFHSLEDRCVKRFIRGDAERMPVRRGLPPLPQATLRFHAIADAVLADDAESAANPRSRSAVLRVAERLP
ncbi:MAG: 16S rRNA (cytosine(1402)-N(4))-methyltransferase RsmH [Pseudomonadota bacterium]|nr:16S rRNA (cytosine(1402)-N(4))-methyltransferase RsmH [Pseudomonadota bacterium]